MALEGGWAPSCSVPKGPRRSTIAVHPKDLARFKQYKVAAYSEKFGPHYPHEDAFHDLLEEWFKRREAPRGGRRKRDS